MEDSSKGAAAGAPHAEAERLRLAEQARTLAQARSGVVLSGRVVKGKVVLDPQALADISRRFPNAEISFVAVNAPFDPQSKVLETV